ncbi:aminotransferase class I/II-fold pyridoxal phosphate-dependent enzyme [Cytobacillus horneckiae]|uniref:aminotransferase class I/II-fold pyridoxal phosphate-dependent enzyme n=1 Tax=Cytobacillus horneckiae TaxID=549687 RepID=UPI0039A11F66
MNELARLNSTILKNNPHVYYLLSDFGKRLYYPKGILSQSDEAGKASRRFNATIGIATERDSPMYYKHIQETLNAYNPLDVYPYAPPLGKYELRKEWQRKMLEENPSLQGKTIGMPIVTNGLTNGLSIVADLFIDRNDTIILPNHYWENYHSIFHVRRGANLQRFEFFDQKGKFNVPEFRKSLMQQKSAGKAVVLLNFPNNPSGYTPCEEEVHGIISTLLEAAESNININVILDDAYFGLFYGDSIKESLFGRLAGIHPQILPIKVDGATKENYGWGLRVGFLTFASENAELLEALEQKAAALIRSTISSCSNLSQTIILRSLKSEEYINEKQNKFELIKERALKVKAILSQEKYNNAWTYYPFNSGYFMCLKLKDVDAEALRIHLLTQYGVGTIAMNSTDLRVAFSSIEKEDLDGLFEYIYRGVQDLKIGE